MATWSVIYSVSSSARSLTWHTLAVVDQTVGAAEIQDAVSVPDPFQAGMVARNNLGRDDQVVVVLPADRYLRLVERELGHAALRHRRPVLAVAAPKCAAARPAQGAKVPAPRAWDGASRRSPPGEGVGTRIASWKLPIWMMSPGRSGTRRRGGRGWPLSRVPLAEPRS